jgi:polyphosphate kinase
MIEKLYEAASAGVEIQLIVRSIMCAIPNQKVFKKQLRATSIVDEFLEHGRILVFDNNGADETFIKSADWMVRNLDYRFEVAVRIDDPAIKKQLLAILAIKFKDNVKARILDDPSANHYVKSGKEKIRSQLDIYRYLQALTVVKSSSRKGK